MARAEDCYGRYVVHGQYVDLENLQRVRANFWADFTVNFASESACLVPVEHPEHARAVAQN